MPPIDVGRTSWGFCPRRLGGPISPSTRQPSRIPYCRTSDAATYGSSIVGWYPFAGLRRNPWPSRISSSTGMV
jgi:hypothetical protein